MSASRRGYRTTALVLLGSLFLTNCGPQHGPAEPSIVFTKLPPYGEGDPGKLDKIEGRVTGAHPGQKIVLYAKSGDWWVQPLAVEPFTALSADATWRNTTHPGSAYAALLVRDGYQPSLRTDVLPEKGGAVLAVTKAQSRAPLHPGAKTVLFGGYEWDIRQTAASPGHTRNEYDPANVWTDRLGLLHLRIAGRPDLWTSAEVNIPRSLGYGTYRFVIRDLSHLEPAIAFTMLAQDHDGPLGEMDIEISKWGETYTRNAQFVIQPYFVPANTIQFQAPAGRVTFMLRWSPGRASFKAFQGVAASWESKAVREHVFTSGVPSPGNESVHMNLYVFGSKTNPLRKGTEVIVEKFDYLP